MLKVSSEKKLAKIIEQFARFCAGIEYADFPIKYSDSDQERYRISTLWFDPENKTAWTSGDDTEDKYLNGVLVLRAEYPVDDFWITPDDGFDGEENEDGEWEPYEEELEAAHEELYEQILDCETPEEIAAAIWWDDSPETPEVTSPNTVGAAPIRGDIKQIKETADIPKKDCEKRKSSFSIGDIVRKISDLLGYK